jgi:hypothetical protein
MAESPRRFPSPWRAEPMPGGYVVRAFPEHRKSSYSLREISALSALKDTS